MEAGKVNFRPRGGRAGAVDRGKLARPYIWRLISFNLWICPLIGPLLHGMVRAASTASPSRMRRVAKLANEVVLAD